MITKVDHIAIAVKDLEASIENWSQALLLQPGEIEEVPEQGVRLCKLKTGEGPVIELVSPAGDNSTTAEYLERRGEGIHHICFEVADIESAMDSLKALGLRLVHEEPAPGAEGSWIAFLHPTSLNGTLIELKEQR